MQARTERWESANQVTATDTNVNDHGSATRRCSSGVRLAEIGQSALALASRGSRSHAREVPDRSWDDHRSREHWPQHCLIAVTI